MANYHLIGISLGAGKSECVSHGDGKVQGQGFGDRQIDKTIKFSRFQIFTVLSIHENSFLQHCHPLMLYII